MNNHYFNQLCVCDIPLPGIDPDRCYVCGGIIPRRWKNQQRAWASEMEGTPTGGAICVVVTIMVILALWAMARITLIASQHDPNPPSISTELTREEARP
jgi:hypothetical protein